MFLSGLEQTQAFLLITNAIGLQIKVGNRCLFLYWKRTAGPTSPDLKCQILVIYEDALHTSKLFCEPIELCGPVEAILYDFNLCW